MSGRKQHLPWHKAGESSETEPTAEQVVRTTGWVFDNRTGSDIDLAAFVRGGDEEVGAYVEGFHLDLPQPATLVEIGSGIGRMTSQFTHRYERVIACDLDAAFLERCRETVSGFGVARRLETLHVRDGRTLVMPDHSADVTFSYITLQHCHRDDALALAAEAVRVTRPGGRVALNFRTWTGADVALWPAGKVMRAIWRVPKIGPMLARRRVSTRLGWQANRLHPDDVVAAIGDRLHTIEIFRSPARRPFRTAGTTDTTLHGINRSHWWLVADVADAADDVD